ncbi:SCO4402 family protein [Streptomyces beigongshangae]|uniref:SCO4402 family protein n=1 Tax=Streptomyces beigongshangae TaxID=2841597 RepID=UPI001C85EDDB|nr:hypothetical protein [Streptomyces sp. REN17]
MELPKLSDVTLPEMRRSVISAIGALADRDYQKRVWVDRIFPKEGYYDDFAMNLHILFDDTLVLEDPASQVGTILKCHDEVTVMEALATSINTLLAHEGEEKEDAEYMSSPLWESVVNSAIFAHRLMTR